MLEADGIQYEISNRNILSNIYLRAEQGEVTAIVGSNGCGKSILLQIIFGSVQAAYASIRINGQKLKPGIHSDRIQYLPQFNIFPENINIDKTFQLYDLNKDDFMSCFPTIQMNGKKKLGELSKGTKRLVETYIFLKNDCAVTLLDEPFSFIMPVHIEKIKELINTQKRVKTILLTDHMFLHIQHVCDRLYLIRNGASLLIARPEDLIQYGYLPVSFLG